MTDIRVPTRTSPQPFRALIAFMIASAMMPAIPAAAQSAAADLAELSLESLMETRITSVSREAQEFLRASAAAFVITPQDIRRSGATDIAELLRMVPGVDVAQINSSTWALSVRGFTAQYATKLLVLVDGRSVYDPGFSGVFWHLLNLPLEDIERIEVIRGPGATMWGANAMNGVISITTKRANRTRGGLLTVDAGTARPGEGSLRFGGDFGTSASYRAFARQTTRAGLRSPDGANGGDEWNMTDVGARLDWDASARDSLTVQGGGYRGVTGDRRTIITSLAPVTFASAGLSGTLGHHALARWTRSLSPGSEFTVQFYYDHRRHTRYGAKEVDTIDLDLQQSNRLGRHRVMWGAGYRKTRDFFEETLAFSLTPAAETERLGSAFVQDEIALVPERFFVTLGSKFEYSSFSGGNVQPNVRAVWQPTARQSLWAATARAVRTPNRVERGLQLTVGAFPAGNLVGLVRLSGQPEAGAEQLRSTEVGYRYQPARQFWFDVTAFQNTYNDLSVVEAGPVFFEATPAPAHLVAPLYFANQTTPGSTRGAEVAARFQAHDAVTLNGSFTLLRMDLGSSEGATAQEGRSPGQQGYFASTVKLPGDLEVSGHLYIVGRRPALDLPSYTRLDANGTWQATNAIRVRLVGQNLFGSHLEIANEPSPANTVRRSIHAELSVGF